MINDTTVSQAKTERFITEAVSSDQNEQVSENNPTEQTTVSTYDAGVIELPIIPLN